MIFDIEVTYSKSYQKVSYFKLKLAHSMQFIETLVNSLYHHNNFPYFNVTLNIFSYLKLISSISFTWKLVSSKKPTPRVLENILRLFKHHPSNWLLIWETLSSIRLIYTTIMRVIYDWYPTTTITSFRTKFFGGHLWILNRLVKVDYIYLGMPQGPQQVFVVDPFIRRWLNLMLAINLPWPSSFAWAWDRQWSKYTTLITKHKHRWSYTIDTHMLWLNTITKNRKLLKNWLKVHKVEVIIKLPHNQPCACTRRNL